MTCPCGHHAACVPTCALMDYPGYQVDWNGPTNGVAALQTSAVMPTWMQRQVEDTKPEWIKQQIAAEVADIPSSPPLPDVTRSDRSHEPCCGRTGGCVADCVWRDPAPVSELVQEIDAWYAANDPLMAGAGDGNSPPWVETEFVTYGADDTEHLLSSPAHAERLLDSILEARGSRYGKFADNALVAQQIKHALTLGPNFYGLSDDQLEALHQIAAKISRIVTGDPDYVDNWDDIAGYAKLVAERLRG